MRAIDPIVTSDNIQHPYRRHPPLVRRHGYPRPPGEIAARWHPADTRAAHRGRGLPRGNGPGPHDERLPLGAAGRRTRDPCREGGAARGCIRYAQQAYPPRYRVPPLFSAFTRRADGGPSLQPRQDNQGLGAFGTRLGPYLPPCAARLCARCCARRGRGQGPRHSTLLKASLAFPDKGGKLVIDGSFGEMSSSDLLQLPL
ncbi:hypothetical protein EDB89DRAFT_1939797 [Lactarius sanguifluus]|nr:hypothetical protein EDB89DRAFT_1939797 [Lactarius sanguifluus]